MDCGKSRTGTSELPKKLNGVVTIQTKTGQQ